MDKTLLDFVRRFGLLPPGSTVCCAVSGGPDSMAMLDCLLSLRETLGITVCAAHFNHGLRGAESDGDEALTAEFCRARGVPLAVGRADVAAEARGESIEAAARRLRYAFLESQPGLIATAHTADDNAETVLMAVTRGSGLQGLSGIPPKRGRIVRPMLAVTRQQVLAYLAAHGVPYRTDSSNLEDGCRRNRIRHHVIPLLRAENPQLCETVLRGSLLLREENAYLDDAARAAVHAAEREEGWLLEPLRALPDALLRRALRMIAAQPLDALHTELLLCLVREPKDAARTELPGGIRMEVRCGLLRTVPPELPSEPFEALLPIPGSVRIPDGTLCCELLPAPPENGCPEGALLLRRPPDADFLTVRSRRSGDRLSLPGGSRSLKRLMIDRGIPARLRERVPVLCDGGAVLAVPGLGISRELAPLPGSPALLLTLLPDAPENEKR